MIKKGDLVKVIEDRVVIEDALTHLCNVITPSGVRSNALWTKADVIRNMNNFVSPIKYKKKESLFTAGEVVHKVINGQDRKLINIEGIFYYAGFFVEGKMHNKRKMNFINQNLKDETEQ